jgi:hypothetical protein
MDDDETGELLRGLLTSGEFELANGDVEASMVMIQGLVHMLNVDPAGEARRRRRRRLRRRLLGSDSDEEGSDLRGVMMRMVSTAMAVLPPSMESIDWMAQMAAAVVDSPTAVSASTREETFGVLGALVGQVNATEEASMALSAAASVTHGLNSLMLSMGAEAQNSSDSEEAWESDSDFASVESEEVTRIAALAVGILNDVASSLVKSLSPGEAPQELVSALPLPCACVAVRSAHGDAHVHRHHLPCAAATEGIRFAGHSQQGWVFGVSTALMGVVCHAATQVSATLSAKVQNAGAMDSPSCPLFGGAIPAAASAGGAGAVTLPASLRDAGLSEPGDAVVLRLVSVAVSPHHTTTTHNTTTQTTTTHTTLATAARRPASAVLTIALESASSAKPLVVKVIGPHRNPARESYLDLLCRFPGEGDSYAEVANRIGTSRSLTRPFRDARRFPSPRCSPYSHVHVRCKSLGFVHRSRAIFCRPVPLPNVTIRNFCIAVRHPSSTL